jgi:hypothetical protein
MEYRLFITVFTAMLPLIVAGCGSTKLQEATEQLVLSSAVDRSVAMIDFRPLAGQRVFLDTEYLKNTKSPSFVNADYVTSSLRQQIMAAGCMLQDTKEQADLIIEARLGTLGADDHRVTYGIPENNGLATAASLLAQTPTPSVPEIALARRDAREGAAKIAAFAYERESKVPVWQSGISQSIATSRNTWVLGVGPFQGGSIREGSRRFARATNRSGRTRPGASPPAPSDRPVVEYTAEVRYDEGWPLVGRTGINGRPVGSGLPIVKNNEPAPLQDATDIVDGSTEAPTTQQPASQQPASQQPGASMAAEPGMIEFDALLR